MEASNCRVRSGVGKLGYTLYSRKCNIFGPADHELVRLYVLTGIFVDDDYHPKGVETGTWRPLSWTRNPRTPGCLLRTAGSGDDHATSRSLTVAVAGHWSMNDNDQRGPNTHRGTAVANERHT